MKQGAILTDTYGWQRSRAIEVLEWGQGYSLDIGFTKRQFFAGVSKDIISDVLDVGARLATNLDDIEPYVGFHIRF